MTVHPKTIRIIGVPMDLGQNRRGVDMGPSALRYAGLQSRLIQLGHTVYDEGNIPVPNPEEWVDDVWENRLKAVTAVCNNIYQISQRCIQDHEFALFIGGDHSISVGTVSAAAKEQEIGVIWVDAHADFNTVESSPSGNIHGMPVASLVGDGPSPLVNIGYEGAKLQPQNIVQIGIRDVDIIERSRLRQSGIHVFTMRDIDEHGMATIAQRAIDLLGHLSRIHISLDMDSLEPDEAPGVGTPVPGGLSYREAHLLMEMMGDAQLVQSLDIVEINPILDDRNKTAELAVGLAASLLGKRIL